MALLPSEELRSSELRFPLGRVLLIFVLSVSNKCTNTRYSFHYFVPSSSSAQLLARSPTLTDVGDVSVLRMRMPFKAAVAYACLLSFPYA